MHIAPRDDPDKASFIPKREGHMQPAPIVSAPKGMESYFRHSVPFIQNDQKRLIKENLFRLRSADLMLVGILTRIAYIPVKARNG
jgi:hypothetical protein